MFARNKKITEKEKLPVVFTGRYCGLKTRKRIDFRKKFRFRCYIEHLPTEKVKNFFAGRRKKIVTRLCSFLHVHEKCAWKCQTSLTFFSCVRRHTSISSQALNTVTGWLERHINTCTQGHLQDTCYKQTWRLRCAWHLQTRETYQTTIDKDNTNITSLCIIGKMLTSRIIFAWPRKWVRKGSFQTGLCKFKQKLRIAFAAQSNVCANLYTCMYADQLVNSLCHFPEESVRHIEGENNPYLCDMCACVSDMLFLHFAQSIHFTGKK